MNRRRLEVEAWRDAMLAVAGTLDRTLGGPSLDLADAGQSPPHALRHRQPARPRTRCCGCSTSPTRTSPATSGRVTTVPLQQLFVLNSEFMVRNAKALAARLREGRKRRPATDPQRAFVLLYGRPPTDREAELGLTVRVDYSRDADNAHAAGSSTPRRC